jgi:SAM-dependent methyltransferase
MSATEFWHGKNGEKYHKRNRVNWALRAPHWHHIVSWTGCRSYLEFGCGPGWNLSAIKNEWPQAIVKGVDINALARNQARAAGIPVYEFLEYAGGAEMVFTCGCLIHIPPDKIKEQMLELVHSSYDYILAIEYEADQEEEIEYQGQMGLLWKRPYGEMYLDLGLTAISTATVGPDQGFDNCRWWLMRK